MKWQRLNTHHLSPLFPHLQLRLAPPFLRQHCIVDRLQVLQFLPSIFLPQNKKVNNFEIGWVSYKSKITLTYVTILSCIGFPAFAILSSSCISCVSASAISTMYFWRKKMKMKVTEKKACTAKRRWNHLIVLRLGVIGGSSMGGYHRIK